MINTSFQGYPGLKSRCMTIVANGATTGATTSDDLPLVLGEQPELVGAGHAVAQSADLCSLVAYPSPPTVPSGCAPARLNWQSTPASPLLHQTPGSPWKLHRAVRPSR